MIEKSSARTPVLHIPEVEFDPTLDFLHRVGLSARPIDLGPTGHSRLHVMTEGIMAHAFGEDLVMRHGVRAGAHDRHFPAQYVQQLRQFVDAGLSQHSADARHAFVALGRLADLIAVLGDRHGAKFENLERPAVEAAPGLPEQHRAFGIKPDGQIDQAEDGQEEEQRQRRHGEIEKPFCRSFTQAQRLALDFQRQGRTKFIARIGDEFGQRGVGDHGDGNGQHTQGLCSRQHFVEVTAPWRQENIVNVLAAHKIDDLIERRRAVLGARAHLENAGDAIAVPGEKGGKMTFLPVFPKDHHAGAPPDGAIGQRLGKIDPPEKAVRHQ